MAVFGAAFFLLRGWAKSQGVSHMSQLRMLGCVVVAWGFTWSLAAQQPELAGQTPGSGEAPVRIVESIDDAQMTTLKGNTHPLAIARFDKGRVSPDLEMGDLILVLRRSSAQQEAFDAFVASQYNKNSPNFHLWLTPEQIFQRFGPAPSDIQVVENWLMGHGISVDAVSSDGMSIRFSGSAAQVEEAFHTEFHNLEVKSERHVANMRDPQIPAALAPVVVGVKALHNFFPRPLHRMGGLVTRDPEGWRRVPLSAGNLAGRSG